MQPLSSSCGLLAYNGEIYNSDISLSDTTYLFQRLTSEPVMNVIEALEGPFSFIFYDANSEELWIVRDVFGRRSLVWTLSGSGKELSVSSVSSLPSAEVPAGKSVFKIDLRSLQIFEIQLTKMAPFFRDDFLWTSFKTKKTDETLLQEFEILFQRSVAKRVLSLPVEMPLSLLFSGGLDSSLLASACAFQRNRRDKPIDLLCVYFSELAPDKLTALCSYKDLITRFGCDSFRLILVEGSESEFKQCESLLMSLMNPKRSQMDMSIGIALFLAAQGKGRVIDPRVFESPQWHDFQQFVQRSQNVEATEANLRKREKLTRRIMKASFQCSHKFKENCLFRMCKKCCKRACFESGQVCHAHTPKIIQNENIEKYEKFVTQTIFGENILFQSDSPVVFAGQGADELFGGYARHRTKEDGDPFVEVKRDLQR